MVVDAVVRHWGSLVAEREGRDSSGEEGDGEQTVGRMTQDQENGRLREEERHHRLLVKAELFYSNDGMVVSTYPGWL